MKNLVRAIAAFFICSSIFSTIAYASSQTNNSKSTQIETLGVSDFFVNFTDKAFSDINALSISDSNGKDVTKKYVKSFTNFYSSKDYKSIQELIKNDKLLVSYKVREVDTNSQAFVTPLSYTTEHYSQSFYHLAQDSGKKFPTKEWLTTLSGTAVVNPNNGGIISASSPTLNVDANFGSAFDVTLKNISTGYKINSSTIDYYASYNMTATLAIPIGGLSVGYELDYGSYYDKFTAYPAF